MKQPVHRPENQPARGRAHTGEGSASAGSARAALRIAAVAVALLSGCYDDEGVCCDSECGYYVSDRPIERETTQYGSLTWFGSKPGACPAGTEARSLYCINSWHYPAQKPECGLAEYWGSTEGDGATIDAVRLSETATTVTARVTVSIPGTGLWAEPAVLSIVGPADASRERWSGSRLYDELIAYPGGIPFTYAAERTVAKAAVIRFGLLRVEDERVSFTIGATQSREVKLNRPRISTVLGSAQ